MPPQILTWTLHLEEMLTSICARRPSHSFFSASISAFSAAMATVAGGCYWRRNETVTLKQETRRKKMKKVGLNEIKMKCVKYIREDLTDIVSLHHVRLVMTHQHKHSWRFLLSLVNEKVPVGCWAAEIHWARWASLCDPDNWIWDTRLLLHHRVSSKD